MSDLDERPSAGAAQQPPGLAAVLFDMDGLLVDSEELWFAAEAAVMAGLGATWEPADQAVLVGGPIERTTAYMLAKSGASVPAEVVAEELLARMEALLRAELRWRPGARRLLHEVHAAGVPAGLVSSSQRRIMEAVLVGVGAEHFAVTVSGDDVTRAKPAPEPYLLAASRLGVDPARCVVLEDSPTGTAAGLAAGCVTVAVPSIVDIPPGPGLTVVRSLTELDVGHLRALVRAAPV
jgi:HAD superfamily hydrolase (TIGR01509 family)